MGPRLGMRDRAWLGMLTATACDAGIDRWADMRDAESGIRDPGSGMIPKEGSGIISPAPPAPKAGLKEQAGEVGIVCWAHAGMPIRDSQRG